MAESFAAFAPGRANLIGEHTDYNDGLALPFAIDAGVTVTAVPREGGELVAHALDRGEEDRFALAADPPTRTGDWRDFVRGAAAELQAAGYALRPADLAIQGGVPPGAGLGSSAALTVALCLALLAVSELPEPSERIELARLCSRVENRWVGARTGLLDQVASLLGEQDAALRVDFRTLEVRRVPLELGGWRLVTVDSGERRSVAASGYNERRSECERARELLGLESLRDLYDASTGAVEETVRRLRKAGAAGARIMGGGFGGHVLALLPPDAGTPEGAFELKPSGGAHLVSGQRRSGAAGQ